MSGAGQSDYTSRGLYEADGVYWKTPEIMAWADGRPFAWIDDEITDADREWVRHE